MHLHQHHHRLGAFLPPHLWGSRSRRCLPRLAAARLRHRLRLQHVAAAALRGPQRHPRGQDVRGGTAGSHPQVQGDDVQRRADRLQPDTQPPQYQRLRPQQPARRYVRQRSPAAVDLPAVQGPDRPGDRERYRLVGVHRDPARLLPARIQARGDRLAGPRRPGQDHRRRGQRVRARRHRPPAYQGLLRDHVLAQRGAAEGSRHRRLESFGRLRLQGRGRPVLARVPHRRHHQEPRISGIAGRGGGRAQRARGGVRIHGHRSARSRAGPTGESVRDP